MKKAVSLLLALALLSGCGAPAEPEVLVDEPPAEEKLFSLPEPRRLEPISASAIVTEGRKPAESYEHILERSSDGALTAYTFPESLWQEELPELFDAAELGGRTFAVLGHELVEFDHEYEGPDLDLKSASSGMIAEFSQEDWGGLRFRGAFCLSPPDSAAPCYVAETSAEVLYRDGVFTPQDFHLYSFEQ